MKETICQYRKVRKLELSNEEIDVLRELMQEAIESLKTDTFDAAYWNAEHGNWEIELVSDTGNFVIVADVHIKTLDVLESEV